MFSKTIVTLGGNDDTSSQLYVTQQYSHEGIAWPACSIDDKPKKNKVHKPHEFKCIPSNKEESENVGNINAIHFMFPNDPNGESICVSQATYYPKSHENIQSHTNIASLILYKKGDAWDVKEKIQNYKIYGTTSVGSIEMACVKDTDNNRRIFIYFKNEYKTILLFLDTDKIMTVPEWFPAPLTDNFISAGSYLLPNGILFSTIISAKDNQQVHARQFIDLNKSVRTPIKHCAPYGISSGGRFQPIKINQSPKKNKTQGNVEKKTVTFKFLLDQDQTVGYDFNDTLNPELPTGSEYKFVLPPHINFTGTDAVTGKLESVFKPNHNHNAQTFYDTLYPTTCRIEHGYVAQIESKCLPNSEKIHAVHLKEKENGIFTISAGSGICSILQIIDGKTTSFFTKNEDAGLLFAAKELGSAGEIVTVEQKKGDENIHYVLFCKKNDSPMLEYTLYEIAWKESTIKQIAKIKADKNKNPIAFLECKKSKNKWIKQNENEHAKQPEYSICILFDDCNYWTSTCVGSNAMLQRCADVFAGTKADFFATWQEFSNGHNIEKQHIKHALYTLC